ncbi:DUF2029 domain-containing protein [Yimella sp. cx-573]|nr:DUF2029 domain-containing protein [Yimella sp. cx-573]
MTVTPRRDSDRLTVPSRGEGVVGWATEVIGGPTGRYGAIGRRGASYAVTVLSALASVFVALGVVQKHSCVEKGWGAPESLWRACYSDLAVGLTGNGGPWAAGGPGENQPMLTALLQWLLRQVTPTGSSLAVQQYYFAFGAVLIALAIAATVIALTAALPGTPWLAAHAALSPVLVTASLVSMDAFGVALATIGLVLWMRDKPLAAGVLLGLAVLARSYPLIIIAAIVLVALRDGRTRELTKLLVGAAAAVGVCLAAALAVGGDPFAVYQNWNRAAAGYGSPWLVLSILKIKVDAATLTWLAVAGWLLALLVGAHLVRRPRHATPLPALVLTMLVIVMCTGKAFPVQQAIWVLPLLALTAMRWREHLVWAGVEIVYFVMTFLYIASSSDPNKGVAPAMYVVFAMVRLIAYAGLAWVSWETAEELADHQDPESARALEERLQRELSTAPGDDSVIVGGRA